MTRSAFRSRTIAAFAVLGAAAVGLARDSTAPADETKPVRALLVIGGCCHDYEKQKDLLTRGVWARANVQWAVAYDPDKGTKHLNPVYDLLYRQGMMLETHYPLFATRRDWLAHLWVGFADMPDVFPTIDGYRNGQMGSTHGRRDQKAAGA